MSKAGEEQTRTTEAKVPQPPSTAQVENKQQQDPSLYECIDSGDNFEQPFFFCSCSNCSGGVSFDEGLPELKLGSQVELGMRVPVPAGGEFQVAAMNVQLLRTEFQEGKLCPELRIVGFGVHMLWQGRGCGTEAIRQLVHAAAQNDQLRDARLGYYAARGAGKGFAQSLAKKGFWEQTDGEANFLSVDTLSELSKKLTGSF